MRMSSFLARYVDSISYFFTDSDSLGTGVLLPRSKLDDINRCEREVVLAITNAVSQRRNELIRQWIWNLVHSTLPRHLEEAFEVLTDQLRMQHKNWMVIKGVIVECPLTDNEMRYYVAVILYKKGLHFESMSWLTTCLEDHPDWKEALLLEKLIEKKMKKDSVCLKSLAGFSFGLVAFGTIMAMVSKKKVKF